ncbi:methylated-DNA--[protein]-cysteine S-methyltransferase [Streptomyces sp. NPDC050617]|uniref:methylated-DNA--[protein]-cysteine S-methyltransferase n=1 Tax=Streptomyces sp. NPDC050617 TaxID=3154628 RepID=UPI003416D16F
MTDTEGADRAEEEAAAAAGRTRSWSWRTLETPIGTLGLAVTAEGLLRVVFDAGETRAARAVEELTRRLGTGPDAPTGAARELPAETERQLGAYFDGRLRAFTVPLDWSLTTGFNRRVLRALAAHVPYGTVVGYQDLARRVGEPGAARAVGTAMGANPLPVVVPCHRVVESDGGIGGFGGGLEVKRALLALEGVLPQPLF